MIYFDCAATSLQKPCGVALRMQKAIHTLASPGRGGHRAATLAAETAYSCREAAAELFHVERVEQVVFTFNATHALNIAINDLVKPGDRVVVSGYEHNSVMRPLYQIGADVCIARSPLFSHDAMLDAFAKELPHADVAICTAMSNVFGYITPIKEIDELCAKYGVPLIVDASQLAGSGAFDFGALQAVYGAMPGHKGLLGPQGTGLLLCKKTPQVLMAGGTGSDSKQMQMPDFLPDAAEAGTHNITGIAGLEVGIRYVLKRGTQHIAAHERDLLCAFQRQVSAIDGIETFYTDDASKQTGVLSMRHEDIDSEVLAQALAEAGIAVRAGMHCAPCAHESAHTLEGGTVRFSFSPFNTHRQVLCGAAAVRSCVNKLKS